MHFASTLARLIFLMLSALVSQPPAVAQPVKTPREVEAEVWRVREQCLTKKGREAQAAERAGKDVCGNQGCSWYFAGCDQTARQVVTHAHEALVAKYGSHLAPNCQATLADVDPGHTDLPPINIPDASRAKAQFQYDVFLYSVLYEVVHSKECLPPKR
jgi:hypothetical protein